MLSGGQTLVIRSADEDDAASVIEYSKAVSLESDYLSWGPGDFTITEPAERTMLREYAGSANRLGLLGLVDETIVSLVMFTGGGRPRIRHFGEFGLTVRRALWGQGIAGLMLDTLITWADTSGVVTKINLRVRTDNRRAIDLYERKGFLREGTMRRDMVVDGRHYDHHVMGLVVGATAGHP